jgi:hypothetical protein
MKLKTFQCQEKYSDIVAKRCGARNRKEKSAVQIIPSIITSQISHLAKKKDWEEINRW